MCPSVNLGGGTFRRGTSDDEIARIILGGIPGTAMPPSNFSESQSRHDRGLPALAGHIARAGRSPAAMRRARQTVFNGKGQCLTCHSVAGSGSTVGPVLTEIGTTRRIADLRAIAARPERGDSHRQPVRAGRHARRNASITGRLLNQDTFTVQLLDSTERLRLLQKSDLREVTVLKESPMPSYRDRLTPPSCRI